MSKYRLLTDDTIEARGVTLYRLQALRNFGGVKVGQLGGYIGGESNLSQCGHCWVSGDARVYGDAQVWGDVVNIVGLVFNITKTDLHIQVGCKLHTFAEWRKIIESDEYRGEVADEKKYLHIKNILGVLLSE